MASGNFHGRTTTIVSFSTDEVARSGFGPFTPDFVIVSYSDIDALRAAMTLPDGGRADRTCRARLACWCHPRVTWSSPRGLRGRGYIPDRRRDPIRLAHTGKLLALDHEGPGRPVHLGQKRWAEESCRFLLSAGGARCAECCSLASTDRRSVVNPLACAVGRAVIALLASGHFQSRSQQLGAHLHARLQTLPEHGAAQVTGRGLWAGVHTRGLIGRDSRRP